MIRKLQAELSMIKKCREDFRVLYFTLLVVTLMHFLFVILFWLIDVPAMSLINIASVLFYIGCLKLFIRSLINHDFGTLVWLITAEVILHAYLACYYLGLASGFQYYIFPLTAFPLFAKSGNLMLTNIRLCIIAAAYLLLEEWLSQAVPLKSLNQNLLQIIRIANLSGFVLLSGSISFAFAKATNLSQDVLLEMATFDKLTGLHNRYSLEAFVEANMVQSKQNGKPLSMLMVDIDYFKAVNDCYGHLCGDSVLSKVANVMQGALRTQDALGRWGGEEFMVVLPETDPSTLALLAERLRLAIMHTDFTYKNKHLSISVTVGGATMLDRDTVESLISRTDQALYHGKRNGRNCYYFQST